MIGEHLVEKDQFNFTESVYEEYLKEISGVKFTPREIEVIAFILNGRSGKKAAAFLSISPKTVENHTRNIMGKLKCNSKEHIIDFIEKSGKILILKQYYLSLIIHKEFEETLKKIALPNEKPICLVIHWLSQEDKSSFLTYLKAHLKLAGIKVSYDSRQKWQSFSNLLQEPSIHTYSVYLLPQQACEECPSTFCSQDYDKKSPKLFIFPERNDSQGLSDALIGFNYLDLTHYKNYYLLVFEILKGLFPQRTLENTVGELRNKIIALTSLSDLKEGLFNISEKSRQNKKSPSKLVTRKSLRIKKIYVLSIFICLGLGCLWLQYLAYQNRHLDLFSKQHHLQQSEEKIKETIRSELGIPIGSILLDRPELISHIEDKFKEHLNEIQTIALTGIGGSGKTTLARQYARLQNMAVAWELNAESKETLLISFESLAHSLSKTAEEKKELSELQEIKNAIERATKTIHWVKERLKAAKSWLLIYDNVEKFSDVKKNFPSNPQEWGRGQIIITTRDTYIQKNRQVNCVLEIGELKSHEKLELFARIINQDASYPINESQKKKSEAFLVEIPPFPLDIAVAAYYLKTTSLPYEKYLEYLRSHDRSFESIQKNILGEIGDYTKTRYSIISISIKKLISEDKSFLELLLLISLLDSQDIPRDLLRNYKSDIVIDNFIFNLKKYFLITNQSTVNNYSAFSIHRSTQVLTLAYLMKALDPGKVNALIKPMADALTKYMLAAIDTHDFQSMRLVVNHCEAFLNHSELLDESTIGDIQGELGGLYFYLGRYSESTFHLERSLTKLNASSPKKYISIARSLRYLGNVHRDLGGYEKSRDLFEQSHAIYEKYFPNDYSGMARSFTYLGIIYRNLGNYEKARDLLKKSLLIYEKQVVDLKQKMLGIARALAYLGSVERILGDYESASEHLERSLIIFKEYFPGNHQKVGWILAYLGNFYRESRNYDKSRDCLEKSYEIYTQYFSTSHLKVAWVSLLLGSLYHEVGDFIKANKSLEQCLAVYEKEYGKDHIETAKVFLNLGQAYSLGDNLETAEKFINVSLGIFKRNNHPESHNTLKSLANLYLKRLLREPKSKPLKEKAIDCLNQALKIIELHFPKGSVHAAKIHSKIQQIKEA